MSRCCSYCFGIEAMLLSLFRVWNKIVLKGVLVFLLNQMQGERWWQGVPEI